MWANAHIEKDLLENNPNSYGWEIYSWELPIQKVNISVFDKNHEEKVQTFHIYESLLISAAPSIESFKKSKGKNPFLSQNSDPNIRG